MLDKCCRYVLTPQEVEEDDGIVFTALSATITSHYNAANRHAKILSSLLAAFIFFAYSTLNSIF